MTYFAWIIIAALGLALLLGWAGLTNSLAFIGAPTRRSKDISARNLPIPALAKSIIAQFTELGFRRLGEAQTSLPLFRPTPTEWIFIDADETTIAELMVMGLGPMMQFSSVFADGSVVETGHPFAEKIEDPDFRARPGPDGFEACYQVQHKQIADWEQKHGFPRRISTMDQWLAEDARYRQRFAQRKLWRQARIGVAWQAFAVFAVLVVLVATVFYQWLGFIPRGEDERGILVFLLVFAGVLAATIGSRVGGPRQLQQV